MYDYDRGEKRPKQTPIDLQVFNVPFDPSLRSLVYDHILNDVFHYRKSSKDVSSFFKNKCLIKTPCI